MGPTAIFKAVSIKNPEKEPYTVLGIFTSRDQPYWMLGVAMNTLRCHEFRRSIALWDHSGFRVGASLKAMVGFCTGA